MLGKMVASLTVSHVLGQRQKRPAEQEVFWGAGGCVIPTSVQLNPAFLGSDWP